MLESIWQSKGTRMKGNCFSCGIGIGAGFIEPRTYSMGDKELCWWCSELLKERGVLKIVADEDRRGVEHRVVYLYQDGNIEEMKDEANR